MKKLFTFHGADHKCGCSMISQCVAEMIACMRPQLRILLVHAEQSYGGGYACGVRESMEHIRPYLAERLLDACDIFERSRYASNLYIIGGTDRHGSSGDFHPEMAEFFFEAMAENFDIIICDSGADVEHGLSLGALFSSDAVFVVLRQKESAFRHYEWMRPLYSKLGLNIDAYVLNMFSKSSAYTREYAADRTGSNIGALFPVSESAFGGLAELEEKSLLYYRDSAFAKDIKSLAEFILKESGPYGAL